MRRCARTPFIILWKAAVQALDKDWPPRGGRSQMVAWAMWAWRIACAAVCWTTRCPQHPRRPPDRRRHLRSGGAGYIVVVAPQAITCSLHGSDVHRSLVDAACTVRCAIVLARTPCSSPRHDVLRRAVASYDVSPAGCSTGQPAMAQEVHYIGQHGLDGVPRSPEKNSMHFLSRFYHRSERAGAGDVVEKSRFLSLAHARPWIGKG